MHDYMGMYRRKIRYPVYLKNRDPYTDMLIRARNIRMRNWRSWGWQVPEKQGPGPGLGIVPVRMDYHHKIQFMAQMDWTDTGVEVYGLAMFPFICVQKYFNEMPRMQHYSYGLRYTKEMMFNHIAFGVDPGNETIDEIRYPKDPDERAVLDEQREICDYLFPDEGIATQPGYRLKWPYPDDNVYRPTYNRGYNRKYWFGHNVY